MTIPHPQTIPDAHGTPAFHAASSQRVGGVCAWGVQRMSTLLRFESGLTDAFREVQRVQSGKERGTTLGEFLQELNDSLKHHHQSP